jgi:hypothetical protein
MADLDWGPMNDFEPRDEVEEPHENLENNFEPLDEPIKDNVNQMSKNSNKEVEKGQNMDIRQPLPPQPQPIGIIYPPPEPPYPPRPPPTPPKPQPQNNQKQNSQKQRRPKGQGPKFRKWVKDLFKRPQKRKKLYFTKSDEEIKQELTMNQYKKLKYDKSKVMGN